MDQPSAGCVTQASERPARKQVRRVAVFVDGFNLYHGLHEHSQRKLLWLDLWALSESLLKSGQTLESVRYFTARVRNDPQGAARQQTYLAALKATGVTVVEGRFSEKWVDCRKCGSRRRSYEEKETDVNLCLAMLESATAGEYDMALVVTGDSDIVPAVRAVRRLDPGIRQVAVFPPKRFSDELKRAVDASMHLGIAKIRQAQLPPVVVDGQHAHSRPAYWQ
nr:NYN domain-containing protein [uncultured Ornithinimicrobium sp.]